MAVERWRKTEKMTAALDAYNAEFPLEQQKHERYTDYTSPSPEEENLAREFAREYYEVGEKMAVLQDRARAIREWQMRFYAKYPMASAFVYKPPPKEEPKPKIAKKPMAAPFFGYSGFQSPSQYTEVVLTQKELNKGKYSISNDYVDATAFGDPQKTYLAGAQHLLLDGQVIGNVTEVKQDPTYGMTVKAQITDKAVYDHLTKGYQFKAAGVSSLTVDDVKKSYDQIKKTISEDQFKAYMYGDPNKDEFSELKALLDQKIKANLMGTPNQIISVSTPGPGKKWEFKNLPPFPKDGLFKKKSGK